MNDSVSIPLSVLHKSVLNYEMFMVYAWLRYYTDGNTAWVVDYNVLSKRTGLPMKKISFAIRKLELAGLIECARNKKVAVSVCHVPERIESSYAALVAEIQCFTNTREQARSIAVDIQSVLHHHD